MLSLNVEGGTRDTWCSLGRACTLLLPWIVCLCLFLRALAPAAEKLRLRVKLRWCNPASVNLHVTRKGAVFDFFSTLENLPRTIDSIMTPREG